MCAFLVKGFSSIDRSKKPLIGKLKSLNTIDLSSIHHIFAKWLSEQELYQKYKIKVNESYIRENLNNTQLQNVIIESADENPTIGECKTDKSSDEKNDRN